MAKKTETEYEDNPELAFLSLSGGSPFESREKRHKRTFIIQFVLILLLIGLNITVFAMYYSADRKYKDDCKASYEESLSRVISVLGTCINDNFNYDSNFREIIGELSTMRSLVILFDEESSHQVCLTELYYSTVKIPNQFREHASGILDGLKLIEEGKNTEGFSLLKRIIDEMDTLDY